MENSEYREGTTGKLFEDLNHHVQWAMKIARELSSHGFLIGFEGSSDHARQLSMLQESPILRFHVVNNTKRDRESDY